MNTLEWMKETQVFRVFNEDKLEQWAKQVKVVSYGKGETVYNEEDTCLTLDILLSGELVAYSLSENGSQTIMKEFLAGCIIGANILYAVNANYPLNIYCAQNSKLLRIEKELVSEMLHNYEFTMQYISSISANSQNLSQKVALIGRKSLRQNLIDYFKQQMLEQRSNRIELPISKKELADYMGVQRPSLFRELKKMKAEGLIEVNNRFINCQNIERNSF